MQGGSIFTRRSLLSQTGQLKAATDSSQLRAAAADKSKGSNNREGM